MNKFFPLLILVLSFHFSRAQEGITEPLRTRNYIFKISNNEAEKIYKENLQTITYEYFHTLIDSSFDEKSLKINLPPGHYIHAKLTGVDFTYELKEIRSCRIQILKNDADFRVLVLDSAGKAIPDANVILGKRHLSFDTKTQSYVCKKYFKKKLLTVNYKNVNHYVRIENLERESPLVKLHISKKIIFKTPLKYIYVPLKPIVKLPYDMIRWAVAGRQPLLFHNISFFFRYTIDKMFDGESARDKKIYGEIYSNKPTYKPGDTLKIKVMLFKKDNPYRKKAYLDIYQNGSGPAKSFSLKYSSPGVYTAEIVLHDSLELKVDKPLKLWVRTADRSSYISKNLRFENYTLNALKLFVKVPEKEHYRNTSASIFVKLINENDLNVLDGKIKILISPGSVNEMFCKQFSIKDTLLMFEKALDPVGETMISIPDSIFHKSNLNYNVYIQAFNSEFEERKAFETLKFIYDERKIDVGQNGDSLNVHYLYNNVSKAKTATMVYIKNREIRKTESITLPANLLINDFYDSFIFSADSVTDKEFNRPKPIEEPEFNTVYKAATPIRIYTVRKTKNKFSYIISQNNRIVRSGYVDSLDVTLPFKKKGYVVSYVAYNAFTSKANSIFAGPAEEKYINLNIKHTAHAFPGQEIEVKIEAKDEKSKPIKNFSLLSYGITSKLEDVKESYYETSHSIGNTIPLMVKRPVANYRENPIQNKPFFNFRENFSVFDSLSELSSVPYYQIFFPGPGLIRTVIPTDGSKTEFAPFVVSAGGLEAIQTIYIDYLPVYYGFCSGNIPYCFPVAPGIHRLELRTNNMRIEIPNVYFPMDRKTILSLNKDLINMNAINAVDMPAKYTDFERAQIENSILKIAGSSNGGTYIQQNGHYYPLSKYYNNYDKIHLLGPLKRNDSIVFHSTYPQYSHLLEIEPFSRLEIRKTQIKIRCENYKNNYHFISPPRIHNLNLGELSFDKKYVDESVIKHKKMIIQPKRYLFETLKLDHSELAMGMGTMSFMWKKHSFFPMNMHFINLETRKAVRINVHKETKLPTGKYIFGIRINDTKSVIFKDIIDIKTSQKLYYNLDSCKVDTVLTENFEEELFFKSVGSRSAFNYEKDTLFKEENAFTFYDINNDENIEKSRPIDVSSYPYYTLSGQIISADEDKILQVKKGEPLIGAPIKIKGTNMGTVTDIDGNFRLTVQRGQVIVVSYAGFRTVEFRYDGDYEFYTIRLKISGEQLQDVVVMGYGGGSRTPDVTGAMRISDRRMATINTGLDQAMQGRAAGVNVTQQSGSQAMAPSINIRGVSASGGTEPLYVVDGIVLENRYLNQINPSDIESMNVLKDKNALSKYGSTAANGVVVIHLKAGATGNLQRILRAKRVDPTDAFSFTDEMLTNSWNFGGLRKNFRDYAFWQPFLTTDNNGEASFKVKLPDDITRWNLYTIGYENPKRIEVASTRIHAAKPLAATLPLPVFLTEGDTSILIGKTQNYFRDSISMTTKFFVNDSLRKESNVNLKTAYVDSLIISPSHSDSLKIKYTLSTSKGYLEGEERKLPVYPQGIEENIVQFLKLNGDTVFEFKTRPGSKVSIRAEAHKVEFALQQAESVLSYRHLCNEQLSSKLKSLLAKKKIMEWKGKTFEEDKNVNWIIKRLIDNQNKHQMWSWWNNSPETSYWISKHVFEALQKAAAIGYKVNINHSGLIHLAAEIYNTNDPYDKADFLHILSDMKIPFDFETNIKKLEQITGTGLDLKFSLIKLRQKNNLPYKVDTLKETMQKTHLGNIYWKSKKPNWYGYADEIKTTLLAYDILNKDSIHTSREDLARISNYIIEYFHEKPYLNTLEAANIIETLLPEWLGERNSTRQRLYIEKITKDTIRDFTYEKMIYQADSSYRVIKKGRFPLYLSVVSKKWNTRPVSSTKDFEIKTYYKNKKDTILQFKQGEEIIQYVEIKVLKQSTYAMLEIPIPAGCSYVNKDRGYNGNETSREYYPEKVAIFFDKLHEGKYQFKVQLLPRYKGVYKVNPAQICLMYMPDKLAITTIKTIKIK